MWCSIIGPPQYILFTLEWHCPDQSVKLVQNKSTIFKPYIKIKLKLYR